ncbi:helix-turn-helix transcriptional regulator [Rhizobium sp. 60-20]|uniref:helix-turn-helix domain-containing protein n=1 Tax=Rhizobium sp. 60-20 TaxID=1895819 RepID=UPI0025E1B532|nr:helix-turn-helix transcriptional regulator [Rhizobium sp. 60-20]
MAPVKKELANLGRTYIAEWRESRGLTQEELAERISMSRSTLSKIETSDSPYTQRTLEAIALALGCKPHDLLMPVAIRMEKSPEDALRSAMLAYGVDHGQIERAMKIIATFIPSTADEERSGQTPPDDQSQLANRPHESAPSE